jgi:hypothetical protein
MQQQYRRECKQLIKLVRGYLSEILKKMKITIPDEKRIKRNKKKKT